MLCIEHLWTDFFQTWCDDGYYSAVLFDSKVSDLHVNSWSRLNEKAGISALNFHTF